MYKPRPKQTLPRDGIRKSSVKNDKGNNRLLGHIGKSRCSSTIFPTSKEELCPMNFTVYCNDIGFYILGGCGNNCHCSHPKLQNAEIRLKSRQIPLETVDLLGDIKAAQAVTATAANIVNIQTGLFLP